MIIEVLISMGVIFLLSFISALVLRGALNVRKWWIYIDEFAGFILLIGLMVMLIFFGKYPTFEFIMDIIAFTWSLLILFLLFIIAIILFGINLGNKVGDILRK